MLELTVGLVVMADAEQIRMVACSTCSVSSVALPRPTLCEAYVHQGVSYIEHTTQDPQQPTQTRASANWFSDMSLAEHVRSPARHVPPVPRSRWPTGFRKPT